MFKCMDCECEFEEPETTREFHGLDYGYENQYSCPNCGSTDYDDSTPCDICGENAWGSCFCDTCKEEAKDMLNIDFGHFTGAKMADIIYLFTESLDELYLEEERRKK